MTAYLFPGDLEPSARFEVLAKRPLLYDAACFAVGVDPFVRAEKDCRFAQPALVALSLAQWAEIDDGSPSTILLGEGPGEIAALAAAGAISSYDAIWLAAVRGRVMSRLAATMTLAAVALHDVTIHAARRLARSHAVRVARDAAPDEVVLTGHAVLVDAAARTARRGGICARALPAQRVFPSPDFGSLRREWRAALSAVDLRPPRQPVLSCTAVVPILNPRAVLGESLTGSVRIRQSRGALSRSGVRRLQVLGKAQKTRTSV
jgi:acyl transferase domain-containing protein